MKIFEELTLECNNVAIEYAKGKEKKEIATDRCRSLSTIVNQLQAVYKELKIRNRSELSIEYARRVTGVSLAILMFFTFSIDKDWSRAVRRNSRSYSYRVYRPRRNDGLLLDFN